MPRHWLQFWVRPRSAYPAVTRSIILLLLMFSFSAPAAARGPDPGEYIEIIAAYLKGRQDEDPQSGYNLLMAELLRSDSHYFRVQTYPIARAVRDFEGKPRVCIFPSSGRAMQMLTRYSAEELLESDPIDIVTSHIMTRPGTPVFNSFDEIEGRTLAVQAGVAARQFSLSDSAFKIVRAPDDLLALRMVLASRVDAMYGWYPDIAIIAKKNNLPLPDFNPELVIFETATHLVCKKFVGVESLYKIVNTRIADFKKRGKLQEMLGKYARIANE